MNKLIECKTQSELDDCCKNGDIAIVYSGEFTACGNPQVTACGNSQVTACGNSQVRAYGNSQVRAYDNSQVTAYDNSQVRAYDNSQVRAYDNSQVTACGNSQVRAYDNSQVRAYDNSQVTACGNSQVTAYGNSQVTACGNSQVRAYGYVAVTQQSKYSVIKLDKTSVLIVVPEISGLDDYIKRYPVKHTTKYIYLYKAVNLDLTSFRDSQFKYPEKGKITTHTIDPPESGSCAQGLHFSYFDWAVNFGLSSGDFVLLKARIPKINPETGKDNIIVSSDCDGKLRCQYAEIIEVIKDWQKYDAFKELD